MNRIDPLASKPLYGDPCNGCGFCCIATQCPLSSAIFGEVEVCPALEQHGQKLECGLVCNTVDYVNTKAWAEKPLAEAFALMLGAGVGCDGEASEADTARRPLVRDQMIARAKEQIDRASPEALTLIRFFQGGDV